MARSCAVDVEVAQAALRKTNARFVPNREYSWLQYPVSNDFELNMYPSVALDPYGSLRVSNGTFQVKWYPWPKLDEAFECLEFKPGIQGFPKSIMLVYLSLILAETGLQPQVVKLMHKIVVLPEIDLTDCVPIESRIVLWDDTVRKTSQFISKMLKMGLVSDQLADDGFMMRVHILAALYESELQMGGVTGGQQFF